MRILVHLLMKQPVILFSVLSLMSRVIAFRRLSSLPELRRMQFRQLSSVQRPRTNFLALSDDEFVSYIKEIGQPAFRAQQVKSWIYERGETDFLKMVNLPEGLRNQLQENVAIGSMNLAIEKVSKDGTVKRAYNLTDGQIIESVLMPYQSGRWTACISSQAGCAMGCVFCATGQMGFFRQLSADEIFEQAFRFAAELAARNQRLSNVVFMGMGEPLTNYDNVMAAVNLIHNNLGIGARHITISTSGIVPRIKSLADNRDKLQVGLAVSLHQTTDVKRSALMPVNRRYPIADLLDACRYYISKTNRRISFEWALISGETDDDVTAHELGRLLRGMLCHVNVIPLNPTKKYGGKPTSKEGVDNFIKILASYGIPATPRVRRGIDIDAGCGQLSAELKKRPRISELED